MTWLPATSAFGRSVHGEAATWDTADHLLAVIADAVQVGNWQRSGRKRRKPQPIPRPGQDGKQRKKFGTGRRSIDEAQAFFTRINRATDPPPAAGCGTGGCGRTVHARGMCGMHYQRWRRKRDEGGG